MTELGNRLKETRESKRLSLDDLQEITKIQKRYLIGIEEGNYEMMPGKFYVRAFIKQYCEAVGLEPDEIFAQYKSDVPSTQTDELPELSRVKSRKTISTAPSKTMDMLPKIVGIIAVLGVAVLIYVFVSNAMNNSKDKTKESDQPSETIDFNESKDFTEEKEVKDPQEDISGKDTENKVVEEEKKSEQELTVVSSSGKNSTYELKNTDAFTLKLVATDEAWVGVTNSSGEYVYQATMTAKETKELDVKDETVVVINLGRAQAVELYVNDEKVEYALSPTEVLSQKVTIQFTKAE